MTASLDRVLIVDDDVNLLSGLVRQLGEDYDISTAEDGESALRLVRTQPPFAAVLCDMRMPGMDGIEVLEHLSALAPHTVRMMLTGNADQQTAMDAINRGAIFRFFNKPTPAAILSEGFKAATQHFHLAMAERQMLEETVAGSVRMLTDVLALVAPDIFKRSQRIGRWGQDLARQIKLEDPWVLELAAKLVYLGAIAIPSDVLARSQSGQRLSEMEEDMIRRIPEVGASLIRKVPRLEPVADAIAYQGKNLAERDYNHIGAILDVLLNLDAVSSGQPTPKSLAVLEGRNGQFDADVWAVLHECIVQGLFQAAEGMESSMDVTASAIRSGDVLETDLVMDNGRLVLAAGETVTDVLFLKLQNIMRMTQLQEPIRVRRSAVVDVTVGNDTNQL